MSSYKRQGGEPKPIDPDVKVPAAIRAASLKAEQLHQQAYETEPPAQVEPTEKPVQELRMEDGGGVPSAAETAPPAKPEGREPPPDSKEEWEHKYNSLKPRFDRQNDTITQLSSRINQLERLIANSAQPTPAERRNPDLNFKPINSEEKEAYGEDFLDVAARAAQEKLTPELKKLADKVEELNEQQKKNAKTAMYQFLNNNLPSWRQINRSPRFIAWCNLPDAFSGAIRMHMLQDAFERGDAPRVLRFFNGFLTDEAATDPAFGSQPETPRTPPNGGTNGKVPLEQFAAPGRAKAPAGSELPAEKETISSAQIAQFYLNVQKGVYRGNPAEKDRLERMIFEAQADGRVT